VRDGLADERIGVRHSGAILGCDLEQVNECVASKIPSCPPTAPLRTRTPLHPRWLILFFSIFGCPAQQPDGTGTPLSEREPLSIFKIFLVLLQVGVLETTLPVKRRSWITSGLPVTRQYPKMQERGRVFPLEKQLEVRSYREPSA